MEHNAEEKKILEKERFRQLLSTDSGKWLIQKLIVESNALKVYCKDSVSASEAAYYKGRHDLIHQFIVSKLVNYFGYRVLDDIMNKELNNV